MIIIIIINTNTNNYTSLQRGHYAGIHTSSFKDFLLKTQLLQAITDSAFEHPSEGTYVM